MTPTPAVKPIQKNLHLAKLAALIVSTALCLATGVVIATRPDALAALTVFPAWTWLLPGLGVAAFGLSRKYPKPFLCVVGLWLIQALILSEEPRSLLRFGKWPSEEWKTARQHNRAIRVITINCAGGNEKALAEVAPYNPDIVLVQETPGRPDVEKIAQSLYGNDAGSWINFDTAIMARGSVDPITIKPPRGFFAQARVELRSGITVDVISLRAMTPPFRMDLWNPDDWRGYTAARDTQREQFSVITKQLSQLPDGDLIICGGDFNAPQADSVAATMAPRLRDSFAEAGRGWGDTITNDVPVLRIDQVWISRQLKPSAVVARRTVESDHRMVICDLIVR
jgi:vancomycin resistance protein VanJ